MACSMHRKSGEVYIRVPQGKRRKNKIEDNIKNVFRLN